MAPNCNIQLSLFLACLASFGMAQSQPALIRAADYANNRSLGACAVLVGATILAQYCHVIESLDRKLDRLDQQIGNTETKTQPDLAIGWRRNFNQYTFGPYQYTDYRDLRTKWDLEQAQKDAHLDNYGWWDRLRNYFNR